MDTSLEKYRVTLILKKHTEWYDYDAEDAHHALEQFWNDPALVHEKVTAIVVTRTPPA